MTLSAQRTRILGRIAEFVGLRKLQDRPFVLGVTGIDASGKTHFASELATHVESSGLGVQLVHVDDFHHPRSVRYESSDEAESYFHRSFDLGTLVDRVLEPISREGSLDDELQLLDLATDSYQLRRRYEVRPESVVILEGVFLFRDALQGYLDLSVFLEVSFDVARDRGCARDASTIGEDARRRYDEKYLPAQQRYIDRVNPRRLADFVVENCDWDRPRLLKEPASWTPSST